MNAGSDTFSETSFRLPQGRGEWPDPWWWGSALASPRPHEVWFGLPTGSASVSWLHVLDLHTGEARRLARLPGQFRDAMALPDGSVCVLASHGIHVTDADGRERATLRDIPRFAARLIPFAGGLRLALGWVPTIPPHRSVAIVSVARWEIETRLRIAAVDLVTDDSATLMCSFHGATARLVDDDLDPQGRAIELPRALSPLLLDRRVWCALAEVAAAANVSPPGPRTLRPTGTIAEVDPWTGTVLRSRHVFDGPSEADAPPLPVLIGLDARARLIVMTPDRTVLLVDTGDFSIVTGRGPRVPLGPVVYVGPSRLVHAGPPGGGPALHMLSWS